MRILVDFQNTIGGAPRSLKEHALLLKENGHRIIAVIPENECDTFFDNTDFEIFHLPRFYNRYVFSNVVLIFRYCNLIKQKKIDLIYTNRDVQCLFLSIVSDFCKIPILNAMPGGYITSDIMKVHNDKDYIVYSEENLEAFQKFGFPLNKMFLLRNRLPIPKVKHETNSPPQNEIILTITGNVHSNTLKGLLWFLTFIKKNAIESHIKYRINIAGSNILKTENEKLKLEEVLFHTQQALPANWQIFYLGWVENIEALQAKSHICIGKGRSVIQPAMMGKISFVISERGTLFRCKKDNYDDLLYYNFSGRGEIRENENSLNEFTILLSQKNIFIKLQKEADDLKQRFKEDYATEYAKEKFINIVETVIKNQALKNGYLNGSIKFFRLYLLKINNKIKKNGKISDVCLGFFIGNKIDNKKNKNQDKKKG